MKKFFFVILFIMLVLSFIAWRNNSPKLIISALLTDKGMRDGMLVYKINFFSIIPVGKALIRQESLEEYKGKKVYHLSAEAMSLKAFSKVFSAVANLDSYVDVKKKSPLFFRQAIFISGKEQAVKEITYDQDAGVMFMREERRHIPPFTQDPLSLIFNLRQMDFEKERGFEMNLNTNQKNYTIKGSVTPKEIWVNKKEYRIYVLNAQIFRKEKNPYHKSKVTVVFLKDKKNIPVLIRVFASGAAINAKLIEAR